MVGEGIGQFRQARLNLAIAAFPVLGKIDTGETEIAQGIVDGALLALLETCVFVAFLEAREGLEQSLVLAEPGAVVGQHGETGLICLAQRLVVHGGIEVRHGRPGLGEPVVEGLQRRGEAFPADLRLLGEGLDVTAILRQELLDGRHHMLGLDVIERRQNMRFEQGVA